MDTHDNPDTIRLQDGEAHYMGEDAFVILQNCRMHGTQSVVIREGDLHQLLAYLNEIRSA